MPAARTDSDTNSRLSPDLQKSQVPAAPCCRHKRERVVLHLLLRDDPAGTTGRRAQPGLRPRRRVNHTPDLLPANTPPQTCLRTPHAELSVMPCVLWCPCAHAAKGPAKRLPTVLQLQNAYPRNGSSLDSRISVGVRMCGM